ncbi:translation initiation factor eif-2b subunit family [Trichoderma arundinaceum]|uniref:Translation initiation factor eif-2b subunit family n=1 Tax=Trichoderma arundinaceum TaxID=490622 RepID=A0A395NY57_TRIAR|nr:translation initiation factor eif-2b subunit family [Trichoderma arundinaceum]
MSQLKKSAVAVSFIFKFPDGNVSRRPQVALFRRSGEVNTYRHKYAPISGGVEVTDANPLATAWRELREETTLTSTSLRLFRQGKPYSFTDAEVGRIWTINPFSFILKSHQEGGLGVEGIKIDWEHEGYEWFDPDEVTDDGSSQGVPRLKESLRRVWFDIDLGKDAGSALAAGLRALQGDHESGARQLASKALDIYLDVISKVAAGDRDAWWKNVRFAGWHLWKNGRESMGAPILSVILSSLDIIEKKLQLLPHGTLSKDAIEQACSSIKHFGRTRQQSGSKIGNAFASFLNQHFPINDEPVKIVTLSSSSTITSSISHILSSASASHPLDIHILESRPLFEGVKVAQRISSLLQTAKSNNATTITLHTDASAALASQNAHVLLLGADLIDKSGNVSNKTGSLPAVLAARHVSPKVKVVVLSEKEKILPFEPPGHEENDSEELVRVWGEVFDLGSETGLQDVNIKNVYFEWVPANLIDVYLTEDGVEGTEDVERWAGEVQQKASHFFDDL